MTFAVIVSVALSLALFGGSLLMREQVSTMKDYWYDKVNVSIFLCNKNDATTVAQVRQGCGHRTSRSSRSRPTSRRWTSSRPSTYESSDEAYKHYQEQYGDTPHRRPRSRRTRCRSRSASS